MVDKFGTNASVYIIAYIDVSSDAMCELILKQLNQGWYDDKNVPIYIGIYMPYGLLHKTNP